MTQINPESIKNFFEQATSAYGESWKAQASYYDDMVRRYTKAMTDFADARMTSFAEMRDSQTFNQAFEANLAFEEKIREGMVALQEENTKSWEKLSEDMKGIYVQTTNVAKKSSEKAA